jgi:hypothetical protein
MKRILALLAFLTLAWSIPTKAQVFEGANSAHRAQKAAKKDQKKAAKTQRKAMKKNAKAQRKVAKMQRHRG